MDLTFYATLDASTLKPYLQDLPYLLPLASWWRSDVQLNRPPRLPSQLTHVAIDCGSYTLAQHQLQPGFHFTAEQYVSWIRALGPAVSWAVLPDWPCENVGASEVRRRQVATTNTAVDVLSDYLDAAWCWCPVLQGQHVDDYLRHAIDIAAWVYDLREVYARRGLAGSFRVCLGSLCRRNSLAYIRSIVSQVAQVLPRLPLHLFGVNSTSSSRRATCRMRSSALIAPPGPGVSDAGSTCRPTSNAAPAAIVVSWNSPDGAPHRLGALDAVVRSESRNASTAFSLPYPDIARDFNGHCWQAVARWMQEVNPFQIRMHSGRVGSPGQHEFRSSELRNRHGDSEQMLPDDSFEAAVMAGDQAATDWLRGCERAEPDPMDDGPRDEEPSPNDGNELWLPVLTEDDRGLVREYMLANRYPEAAANSLDHWPVGELRHLLEAARNWKVREAQRLAERAELNQQLHDLEARHLENRAVLDRMYRGQADTLVARDQDRSIIVLNAHEARRSPTGNYLQENQGLDLERQIRHSAAEHGFAIGQPHWDRASSRLFIDLFHLGAETWWDSGQASGLVPIPPHGKVLESKRRYRALYPFQRAAINAAFVNRAIQVDGKSDNESEDNMPVRRQMTTPLSTEPEADPVTAVAGTSCPAPERPATQSATPHEPAPTHARPRALPNGRKAFKLTLWISSTDDNGLADAHGFLQLDGADPVPFCRLKAVPNPLARALQEAYVAIERVRAKASANEPSQHSSGRADGRDATSTHTHQSSSRSSLCRSGGTADSCENNRHASTAVPILIAEVRHD